MFNSAAKPIGSVSVAWEAEDPKVAEGKKKYFGDRIVGKFIEQGRFKRGHVDCATYTLKLYSDFNDESKFGQEPDGEAVTVWGSKLIDDSFTYGQDGSGIKPGDIVEIVYKGRKETANGENEYHDFAVGAFTPKPTFVKAAANAVGGAMQAAGKAVASVGTSTRPAAKPAAPAIASDNGGNQALKDLGY